MNEHKNKIFVGVIIFCIAIFLSSAVTAEEKALEEMTLEELLNVKVKVASKKETSLRESPGIITVINEEQIQKMGARDLIDILRTVPGFSFGVDVEGVVGLGIRGNWAHEGKVSLQIDGEEMNERLFSTTQFGRHFPVDNIKRIEIIRGPGSALYGGYAELGVINIITKRSSDIDEMMISTTASEMKETYGQRNISFSFSKKINDFDVVLHTFLGAANRSDSEYTGFNSDYSDFVTYDMEENSELRSLHLNLSINNDNFKNRLIIDKYGTQVKDGFDYVTSAYNVNYNTFLWSTQYDYTVDEKLTITPKFIYKRQQPYHNNNVLSKDDFVFYSLTAEKITGRTTIDYDITDKVNFIGGIELYRDMAIADDKFDYFIQEAESDTMSSSVYYMNYSLFGQGLFKTSFADFVIGARAEENSEYGSSFVPRAAITKVLNNLHFKVLASQAFRAPGISNVQTNKNARVKYNVPDLDEIESEKTTVFEFETGYKLGSNMFVTANFFDITIDKPIIYVWDGDYGIEYYKNYDQTGTQGAELDLQYSDSWGNIHLTYSHYMEADKNKVGDYAVPKEFNDTEFDEDALLGFPRNKITLLGSVNLSSNLSISPSLIYLGNRYGWKPGKYDNGDIIWEVNTEFDSHILANINVLYDNFLINDLSLGLSMYNVLDEEVLYIQPYHMWHSLLPGPSQEIMLKLGYNL